MCLYISIDIRDELDIGQQESTDEINNGAFLSYQISTGHQPPLNCIFLLQQISTGHQPQKAKMSKQVAWHKMNHVSVQLITYWPTSTW